MSAEECGAYKEVYRGANSIVLCDIYTRTMMTPNACVIVCAVLAVSVPSVSAKARRRQAAWGVPTVYSNLYLEGETGDVGGIEVILVPSDSDWAVVVVGSGIAYDPVVVPLHSDGRRLEFTLPNTGQYEGYGTFRGRVTRKGLVLENAHLGVQVLPRQHP